VRYQCTPHRLGEFSLARGGGGEQRVCSGVWKKGTAKSILQACKGEDGDSHSEVLMFNG